MTHEQIDDHSQDNEAAKLTAFALGETDAADTTAGAGGRDPLIDEIRRCAAIVRQELTSDELPPPSSELRAAVQAKLDALNTRPTVELAKSSAKSRLTRWRVMAIAASIAILIGAVFALQNSSYNSIANLPSPSWYHDDAGYTPAHQTNEGTSVPITPPRMVPNYTVVKPSYQYDTWTQQVESNRVIAGAPGGVTVGLGEDNIGGTVHPNTSGYIPMEAEKSDKLTISGTVAVGEVHKFGGGTLVLPPPPTLPGATPHRPMPDPLSPTINVIGSTSENETRLDRKRTVDRNAYVDRIEREALEEMQIPKAPGSEAYASVVENAFLPVVDNPLSTFSIDVDTASYANMRRFLTNGSLPPPEAVRIEELINYFHYDYPQPEGEDPFSVNTELAVCPWNNEHRLLRIGLQGREMKQDQRPASNLVFLVDVSGSMNEPNKLPLVQESLGLLLDQLGENDRVAIVVYAGSTGLVLPSTGGHDKATIRAAIDRLSAGGSTNGAAGLQLAYQVAEQNFLEGGTNRVILTTDGDFNVGVTDRDELVKMIEAKAKSGVFFTALGYGMGNLKDATLEQLADKGNGNYAYIDTRGEARKVLVEELSGTLVTIAKDVKLQLEFNPALVAAYRLIGYENRVLAAEDFNNDQKDAGDVGAGHSVTALYELVPAGKEVKVQPKVDDLKYQSTPKQEKPQAAEGSHPDEVLTVKLRYKQPDGQTSKLLEHVVKDKPESFGKASGDFKFAAAVASFGMLLRHSQFAGNATFDSVLELANDGLGTDEGGYRHEFLDLVKRAKTLAGTKE